MNYILKTFVVIVFFFSLHASSQIETKEKNNIKKTTPDGIYPSNNLVIPTHTDWTRTHYPVRITEFKKKPLYNNDIVFIGNSLTELGGDWGKRIRNTKVKNRGIADDTTDGLIARLGELIYFKPEQVFILIGINDLFRDDMSSQKVFDNILKIVNQIHDGSPKTKIFVQTILPTNVEMLKGKIQLTNLLLFNAESNAPYELVFLHNHFTAKNDLMDMDLSVDGVHLNEKGYMLWVDRIINLIR